jgi:N-acyl amino acid synthase of PEP-CTERM/exosortase system
LQERPTARIAAANPAPIPLSSGIDSPILLLGIYRAMYRHSRQAGIRFWYAAMERSLARSLDKMGFRFIPVGPQTDYYGAVTPYMADIHELEAALRRDNKALAAWFID